MHYNDCAVYGTQGTTPAVAAGPTDKAWSVAEMIERTANYRKPEPPKFDLASFVDSLPDDV
jgi:hypothetical protein